jgi:hypothetical protein
MMVGYRSLVTHRRRVLTARLELETSMAILPTPEQCAGAILAIFVWHFGLLAGDLLQSKSFFTLWQQRGYRSKDFKAGVQFAVERGWLESLPGGKSYRLTKSGLAAA